MTKRANVFFEILSLYDTSNCNIYLAQRVGVCLELSYQILKSTDGHFATKRQLMRASSSTKLMGTFRSFLPCPCILVQRISKFGGSRSSFCTILVMHGKFKMAMVNNFFHSEFGAEQLTICRGNTVEIQGPL